MFTMIMLETLDGWDELLLVAVYGCAQDAGSYPILEGHPRAQCNDPEATGWVAVLYFFCMIMMGGYILPTILIGVISISFDESNTRASIVEEDREKMVKVREQAETDLPGFFTPDRYDILQEVFDAMDADGELTLDAQEMAPFYQFAFDITFGVDLDTEQTEDIFRLMDMDG